MGRGEERVLATLLTLYPGVADVADVAVWMVGWLPHTCTFADGVAHRQRGNKFCSWDLERCIGITAKDVQAYF